MKTIGVRALKNQLREHLRRVRAGESVLITDRGEVVAELIPPRHREADALLPAGMIELARRELLTLGAPGRPMYPTLSRALKRSSAAQLLNAERGSR